MSAWYPIARDILARDLWVDVPLDWADPDGEALRLYARELVDAARAGDGLDSLPPVVYLQGGPGGKGNRPLGRDPFLTAALSRFRVVLPDQRGTGRSAPVDGALFAAMPPEEAARRLSLMRADSIVRDLEALRHAHFGGAPWWSFGQSYGGFLTLHYLSAAPEALTACAITGGLPGLGASAADVVARTFPRARSKNREFFERLPHLRERVDRVAALLREGDVRLPAGDRLTVRRLQTLGFDFGMGVGFDRVHWLLDEAFADAGETRLGPGFLSAVEAATGFAGNPLYAALQEAIYGSGPSGWAAERECARHVDFAESAEHPLFTGEMVFPWMFDEISALRGFRAGVELLHEREWPVALYDRDRLAANEVPVEAAVYFDDMYVDAGLSLDTAARVGATHAWVTNEFEHDGLRTGDVVERLFSALELRLARSAANG